MKVDDERQKRFSSEVTDIPPTISVFPPVAMSICIQNKGQLVFEITWDEGFAFVNYGYFLVVL